MAIIKKTTYFFYIFIGIVIGLVIFISLVNLKNKKISKTKAKLPNLTKYQNSNTISGTIIIKGKPGVYVEIYREDPTLNPDGSHNLVVNYGDIRRECFYIGARNTDMRVFQYVGNGTVKDYDTSLPSSLDWKWGDNSEYGQPEPGKEYKFIAVMATDKYASHRFLSNVVEGVKSGKENITLVIDSNVYKPEVFINTTKHYGGQGYDFMSCISIARNFHTKLPNGNFDIKYVDNDTCGGYQALFNSGYDLYYNDSYITSGPFEENPDSSSYISDFCFSSRNQLTINNTDDLKNKTFKYRIQPNNQKYQESQELLCHIGLNAENKPYIYGEGCHCNDYPDNECQELSI